MYSGALLNFGFQQLQKRVLRCSGYLQIMEAIGAASAILAIATAGVQCSVKLVTFAGQVKTAPEQITMVAEDVSLNASILHQLGELATENIENEHPTLDGNSNNTTDPNVKSVPDAKATTPKQSIFNPTGLKTVIKLAKKCEEIFESLDQSLRKASQQLHAKPRISGKVKLNRPGMCPQWLIKIGDWF